MSTDGDERFDHAWFAAQQWKALEWAADVHLTADEASEWANILSDQFGMLRSRLFWEVADLMDDGAEAVAFRNRRTLARGIAFRGLGCTLLTLCHELVHCWRPWEEDFHDETDWDLAVILLEEVRGRM